MPWNRAHDGQSLTSCCIRWIILRSTCCKIIGSVILNPFIFVNVLYLGTCRPQTLQLTVPSFPRDFVCQYFLVYGAVLIGISILYYSIFEKQIISVYSYKLLRCGLCQKIGCYFCCHIRLPIINLDIKLDSNLV